VLELPIINNHALVSMVVEDEKPSQEMNIKTAQKQHEIKY
jgi:hypothetical protein